MPPRAGGCLDLQGCRCGAANMANHESGSADRVTSMMYVVTYVCRVVPCSFLSAVERVSHGMQIKFHIRALLVLGYYHVADDFVAFSSAEVGAG
jgi:hypothetical protein